MKQKEIMNKSEKVLIGCIIAVLGIMLSVVSGQLPYFIAEFSSVVYYLGIIFVFFGVLFFLDLW